MSHVNKWFSDLLIGQVFNIGKGVYIKTSKNNAKTHFSSKGETKTISFKKYDVIHKVDLTKVVPQELIKSACKS